MYEERIKKAVISLAIFLVSGFMLLLSLVLFVILNGSVGLPDGEILYLAIPFDKVSCLALPLILGIFVGSIFGIIVRPKRVLSERGQKVGWEDVIVSLVLGIVIGCVLKNFFCFLAFTFSFIAICRLIIAIHYFRDKY